MLPLTPRSHMEPAPRIKRGFPSVPGRRSATELRRLEALIGFEPMTLPFGRSRAGPLRYRAEIHLQTWGD